MALQFETAPWTSTHPNLRPESNPNSSFGPGPNPADRPICKHAAPEPFTPSTHPKQSRRGAPPADCHMDRGEALQELRQGRRDPHRATGHCSKLEAPVLKVPQLAPQGRKASGLGCSTHSRKVPQTLRAQTPVVRRGQLAASRPVCASHLQAMGIDPDGSRSNINTRNPHVRPAQALCRTLPPKPNPWRASYAPAPRPARCLHSASRTLRPAPCTPTLDPRPAGLRQGAAPGRLALRGVRRAPQLRLTQRLLQVQRA